MYKEHEKSEIVSVKEEVEQDVMNILVSDDIMKKITIAVFPFTFNPLNE